jgi:ribose transport system substrate-binding protein
MRGRQRFWTVVLAAGCALAASCSAIGGGGSVTANDRYQLVLIQGVAGDNFYISMECGAREAAEAVGVDLEVVGPEEFSPDEQIPLLEQAIEEQPDAILIAPTDRRELQEPLQEAADAGITIVQVDTTVDDPSLAVSTVASDNPEGGRRAATALAELIGERGPVLVVNVTPGISTTDERQQGFEEQIASYPSIRYLGGQYSYDDPEQAAQIAQAMVGHVPDLTGIFATNLFAAEGAATGLRAIGAGGVSIVAFDAGPAQVQQLNAGLAQALIAQQPEEIGRLGVEQAVIALNGGEPEPEIRTGYETVTQENLDDPEIREALYVSEC